METIADDGSVVVFGVQEIKAARLKLLMEYVDRMKVSLIPNVGKTLTEHALNNVRERELEDRRGRITGRNTKNKRRHKIEDKRKVARKRMHEKISREFR